MFDLKGKVAVVTGARRGMGRTHALALSQAGAKVAVTDLNLPECETVVREITALGGTAKAFVLDVSDSAQVDEVFKEIVKDLGGLDILVNNAGIYEPRPVLEMSEQEWERTIDINLKGQFLCAQRAAKEMIKNHWGRIINISSVASGQVGVGIAGGAHYTATKGGIIAMTETMALEFASSGITVNAIGPGAINTPMANTAAMPEDAKKKLLDKIPLKRMGRPEEVSAAVVFLASKEASYVTGATLFVDGGWLAS